MNHLRFAWIARRRRIISLLLIGAALIAMALGYIEFHLRRPIGAGPAGPSVDRAAFDSPWSDRRVLLLGIGDSVTAGLGAKTLEHSYFQRLIRNPSDEWPDMEGRCLSAVFPRLESINLAVSGTTSLQHLDVIKDDLEVQDADVFGLVVITTGGNDLIHNYGRTEPREGAMYGATSEQAKPWVNRFEQRLLEMLSIINERIPGGCEIFLADIYDPTDGIGDAPSVYLPEWKDGLTIHREYNDVIRRVADSMDNVHVVPLHATFLGHGSHCRQFWRSTYCSKDPSYWYFDNIEDPNDRGYDAARRAFLNTILENKSRFMD